MSGIRNIGIRCCCLSLYKIRAWRTPPRGMLLAVLSLMLIIMSQNVIMFSLVPDYTMFGNQHYQHNVGNSTVVTRCSAKNFPVEKVNWQETEDETDNWGISYQDACVPSRISVLLLSFHYKAWIFGACYYFLVWVFLGSILCGSLYSIYHMRFSKCTQWQPGVISWKYFRTPTRSIDDQEELIDSDDEDHFHDDIPSNNPFD